MSLAGDGLIAIWNDIHPDAREEFYAWHEAEHMPERVGIAGFGRGRRFIRVEAEIEYLTLYETVDTAVLAGPAYLERLDAPTDWTRRVVARFSNVTRSLGAVRRQVGQGDGGYALAAALTVEDAARATAGATLDAWCQAAAARPGIAAAAWSETEQAASRIETAEKRTRPDANAIPDLVILAEASRILPLARTMHELERSVESIGGARWLRPPGIYRLEFVVRAG